MPHTEYFLKAKLRYLDVLKSEIFNMKLETSIRRDGTDSRVAGVVVLIQRREFDQASRPNSISYF